MAAVPKLVYSTARGVQVTSNIALSGTTPKLQLGGASEWMVACISTSSLAFKVQGSMDGSTNWHDLSGTKTPVVGDVFRGPATGFPVIRLLASVGSGAVDFALALESSGAGGSASGEAGIDASELQADIDTTVAGNAVTRTYTAPTSGAKGQFIHNNSDTYSLWYKRVLVGGASSTIASTNKHGIILPGITAYIELNPGFTLDLTNSTGAATTVDINGGEF